MTIAKNLLQAIRKNWTELLLGTIVLSFVLVLGLIFFLRGRSILKAEIQEKLKAFASVAALQFDARDIDRLRVEQDFRTPAWSRVVRQLQAIRLSNSDIVYAYILRAKEDPPHTMAFVADSHCLHPYAKYDLNDDGVIDSADALITPGSPYEGVPEEAFSGYERPITNGDLYADQWGAFMTGYAPIRDTNGTAVAVMAVDVNRDDYLHHISEIFSPIGFFLVLTAGLGITVYIAIFVWRRRIDVWRRIDDERSKLLQLTSHQLGTPLTILKWSVELLRENKETQEIYESVRQHLHNADYVIQRMDSVLSALKTVDEIRHDRLQFHPEFTSLNTLIGSVRNDMSVRLNDKRQRLNLDLDADVTLHMDAGRIATVLKELLSNAIDFSSAGTTIAVRTRLHADAVEVTVEDHGVGIWVDSDELFRAFGRGRNASRYKPDGNGLGLFIVRGIIGKIGGEVRIHSKPGEGTIVSFTLPLPRQH